MSWYKCPKVLPARLVRQRGLTQEPRLVTAFPPRTLQCLIGCSDQGSVDGFRGPLDLKIAREALCMYTRSVAFVGLSGWSVS